MLKKITAPGPLSYLVIFLISQVLLAGSLFYDKQNKREYYHHDIITRVASGLETVLYSYSRISRIVFDESINKLHITDTLHKAYQATPANRGKLRTALFQKFSPTYARLRDNGFAQVHFHFPDGTSFLRMHRPDQFGDALFGIRPSIRIANTEQKTVEGFEEGRHYHAFRYVFPLFDHGHHVGSVEADVPFESVQKALIKTFPAEYFLMLKQTVADRKLFVDQRNNYEFSDLSPDYLLGKQDLANPPAHRFHLPDRLLQKINLAIKTDRLATQLRAEAPFVASSNVGGVDYLTVFIPVTNVKGEKVGYLYSYTLDAAAAAIHKSYLLTYTLATLLSLLLLASHKFFADKLRTRLHFQQALLDSIPTPIFYKDTQGRYLGCNKAHAELLGAAPEELINRPLHDVSLKEQTEPHLLREQELLREGGIDQYETTHDTNGQHAQYLMIYKTPVAAEDGTITGLIGSVFNLTDLKKVEQEKEAIRRHLHLIFDSAGEGIFGLDRDGRVTFCNKAAEKMLGWKAEELLGELQHDRVHHKKPNGSTYPVEECPSALCLHNGIRMTVSDEVYWRKDGTSFPVEYVTTPILDDKNNIAGVVIIFRDITQRLHAEAALFESEAQYRRIFNSTTDALLVFDDKGEITEANRQASAMYGYTHEQLITRSALDIFPPDFQETFLRFTDSNAGQSDLQTEAMGCQKDGSRFPIEIRGAAFELHGRPHFLAVIRDISEQKKAREALRAAMDGAEAANHAKSAFLANMSHEIRTPMNAIIGMNHLALQTKLSADQHRYLKTVQEAANGLLNLLNDILDLSKIEADQLIVEQRSFDLRATMESAVNTMATNAHEKELEILCSLPARTPAGLVGDQMRLKQILLNLLGNAIKFTDTGSVLLRCEKEPAPADNDGTITLHFQVKDTGAGVAMEQQHAIFEAFTQADTSVARTKGGTGLGLAISKKLCAMMGGRIWLESLPGQGSTFHFTARFGKGAVIPTPAFDLPLNRTPAEIPVLIAGRTAMGRMILREMLNDWGFPSFEAGNRQELVAQLHRAGHEATPFGLILLEQRLSAMTVADLLGLIRNEPASATTPVLLLHPTVFPTPCKQCQELGISFCLSTPVGRNDLQKSMTACLRGERCHASQVPLPTTPVAPPPTASSSSSSLNLLLVEDNDANRELAKIILENGGHVVTEAINGVEALEQLCHSRFAGILLDVQMPNLDGLSAARIIRQCEQGQEPQTTVNRDLIHRLLKKINGTHTPIVAMTAHAMAGDREMCLAAGMNHYITKPFQPEDIHAILAGLAKEAPPPGQGHETIATPGPKSGQPPLPQPPADASVARAPACPVTVKNHLTNICKMPPERVEKLFDSFRNTLAGYVADAQHALQEGDAGALRLAAHSLKGGLLNMGLQEWAEVAYAIECDAQKNRLTAEHATMLQEMDRGMAPLFTGT